MGLISRTMIVSQPSGANGGLSCPSAQVQTMACLTQLCEDCSVPAYGPNHLGCLNNGACNDSIPFNGAFTCNCQTGFSGANCEIGLWRHSYNIRKLNLSQDLATAQNQHTGQIILDVCMAECVLIVSPTIIRSCANVLTQHSPARTAMCP